MSAGPAGAQGVDGQVLAGEGRLVAYSNFVKVAHTVFSLPFAFVGVAAASFVHPLTLRTVLLVIAAFGTARFTAMGFNRIADRRLDALNPRTAGRELPAGRMTMAEAWVLVAVMAILFVVSAGLLNPLCLALSPVALAWVTVYSYAKRFTALSHVWLGLGMAISPVGGYLAVTGSWSTPWWVILLLALVVTCWGGGFDVIYSLQDESFDREHGLRSLTVALGARRAILVARLLHALAAVALVAFGFAAGFGVWYFAGTALALALLVWEHRLVRPGDYSKLDAAFFSMNGIISGAVMAGAVLDAVLR
ncbi:MAG TPA: UbiA-like polyprenyltransferase [Gemmatimonadales bacterium]|nr:UbiA-like polyprenyltransferase [Gemmatimonadales bacterium]